MPAKPLQRQAGHFGDIEAREFHRQRFAPQPLAMAQRTFAAQHVLRHPLLHHRALGGGEGVQHVTAGAGERPHVTGLFLAFERAA